MKYFCRIRENWLNLIGLVCNLIAMKFYPLTKEKMEEIQDEVAQIKMKTMAENA